jgi:DNA recombination protein RmuC
LLLDAKQALTDQFKALANEILEEKSNRFTEQNQTHLGALLDPLKSRINELQAKIEDAYIKEGKDRTALGEQVRQLMELNPHLSGGAKNLTRALRCRHQQFPSAVFSIWTSLVHGRTCA